MSIVNVHEAKMHLARLIERVAGGEEIIIAKAGKPVAKLVRYREAAKPERKPGGWKGKVKIAANFDRLPSDVAAAFRGRR